MYHVHTMVKASHAERFIQTLRLRIARAQHHSKSKDILKLVPSLVKSYNAQVHTTIGLKPRDVDYSNMDIAFRNMYKDVLGKKGKKLEFKLNDFVRISAKRLLFTKSSSSQRYTSEIFQIAKTIREYPTNYYFLKDLNGEAIIGTFYPSELVKVANPENGK